MNTYAIKFKKNVVCNIKKISLFVFKNIVPPVIYYSIEKIFHRKKQKDNYLDLKTGFYHSEEPLKNKSFFSKKHFPFIYTLKMEIRSSILISDGSAKELNIKDSGDKVYIGISSIKKHKKGIAHVSLETDKEKISISGDLFFNEWINVSIFYDKEKKVKIKSSEEILVSKPISYYSHGTSRKKYIVICLDSIVYDHFFTKKKILFDFFQKDSVFYTNCFTQSEWTLPAITSLFTGLYPIEHGVYNPREEYRRVIPESLVTLPELIQNAGHATFGYSEANRIRSIYSFERGFDQFIYEDFYKNSKFRMNAIQKMKLFIDEFKHSSFFMNLHLMDIHWPYEQFGKSILRAGEYYSRGLRDFSSPQPQHEEIYRNVGYSNFIFMFKNLISWLQYLGIYEETRIIFFSDHGGKNRLKNHETPLHSDAISKVPILFKHPDLIYQKGDSDNRIVESCLDINTTILNDFGLEKPDYCRGHTLIGTPQKKYAISESVHLGNYECAVRNEKFSYHLQLNSDMGSGEISFDNQKEFFSGDKILHKDNYSNLKKKALEHIHTSKRFYGKDSTVYYKDMLYKELF